MQQRKRFHYPQMHTIFQECHRYIETVEGFDHRAGRFSGGLRTLESSSSKYIKEKHGSIVPKHVCMKRDAGTDFPQAACTAARRASRPCGHRHPGLCRTAHKDTLADSLRLAKNIHDKIKGSKQRPGECLVEVAPAGRRRCKAVVGDKGTGQAKTHAFCCSEYVFSRRHQIYCHCEAHRAGN